MENRKITVTDKKKRLKEKELLNAAYKLFVSDGIENTSIDDIVKGAKVAKGTFYLYFNDKQDILNQLILQKSNKIIKEALIQTEKLSHLNFREKTICFIDYIINYLKDNNGLLRLINKNISWGLYRKAIMKPEEYEGVKNVLNIFIENLHEEGMEVREAEMTLFMILELVGSICFTTIILKEPTEIDEIKPILFKKILAMLKL